MTLARQTLGRDNRWRHRPPNAQRCFSKTQKVLHELDVDFRDEQPIEFIFTRPHPAAVSVRKASAEEQQLGYKKDTLLCAVTIDLNVSQAATACAKPRRQTG